MSHSPLPVCVGILGRVVFLGVRPRDPSWLLPLGNKAAPAVLHRTAGERGPSPDMTVDSKTRKLWRVGISIYFTDH